MSRPQPEIYTLYCVLGDEKNPFPVEITNNKTVGILKERIQDKGLKSLNGIAAHELQLYQVDVFGLNQKERSEVLRGIGDLSQTEELDPLAELSELYPSPPPQKTVHIAIIPPQGVSNGPGVPTNRRKRDKYPDSDETVTPTPKRRNHRHSGKKPVVISRKRVDYGTCYQLSFVPLALWCPREGTVSAILELLLEKKLVQVRGGPASGKSTLMHLLHNHILRQRPEAKVFFHENWPQEKWPHVKMDKKMPGYAHFQGGEHFFLFDDAQTSYWDTRLWLAFKDDVQRFPNSAHVIVFCTYGNKENRGPYLPVPLAFDARVTLNGVYEWMSKPNSYALLLDEEEFCDVIVRQKPKILLKDDLREFVYKLTRGHVGHVMAVLEFLKKKRGASMLQGHAYSLRDFHQDNPSYDAICTHLENDHGIKHVLPDIPALYARAMRVLLLHGSINTCDQKSSDDIRSRLDVDHKAGFVELDGSYEGNRYCIDD
ncbi:hypothetical protein CPB86DRAFT_811970 [Serendipita vermifera]|nr:hypothetical protein CPB86DRAFT_811970 [Serendipita vermifera]